MPTIYIGFNVASLVYLAPWLAPLGRVTPSPAALCARAKRLGSRFVQLLPLRGATGEEEGKLCEGAWNPGTVWDWLTGNPNGRLGRRHPKDIVLFPSPERCDEVVTSWGLGGSYVIDHQFTDTRLIELHPGLDRTPAEIVEACQQYNAKMVVDGLHLQRGYRPDEIEMKPIRAGQPSPLGTNLDDWVATLDVLRSVLAPVFHFHPTDITKLLDYEEPISYHLLHKWLELTKCHKERWIVIEYAPTRSALLSRWASDRLAAKILADVRFCVDTGCLPGSMSTLWQPGDV